MPVDTVIFDVGKVLFQWDLRHLFAKLIDDADELDWFLAHVITPQWHFQHDAGRPLDEMLPELIARFPEHEPLIRAYRARFVETIPGPVPGSLEIVRALHERKVPLFAITNFGAEFWALFRPGQPIFDLFGDIIVSGVEKMIKPDAEIYQLAIRRFGVEPQRCLFVDDNRDNIVAARREGLHGHVFEDAATLKAELVDRGLL